MPSSDDATRKLRSGSRDPLLRVERLCVGRVLDSVDLRVLRGQTLAVVGESGAGKTTLARSVAGLVTPSSGKLLFEGKDLLALGKVEPRGVLLVTPEMFVGPDALAALLAQEPKLLIVDEAFDALDGLARLQLFEQVGRLQDEQALSCLLLTRSLELAAALADEILILHAGQIVESGSTASLLKQPRHPYTQSLLNPPTTAKSSEPPSSGGLEPSEGCRFRTRCPHVYARCAVETPALFAVPGGLSRCFLHDPDGAGSSAPV